MDSAVPEHKADISGIFGGLDRTYEELKRVSRVTGKATWPRLDRTYEELKHREFEYDFVVMNGEFGSYL